MDIACKLSSTGVRLANVRLANVPISRAADFVGQRFYCTAAWQKLSEINCTTGIPLAFSSPGIMECS